MVVRDSAGVRIVEHAASAMPAERWTVDLTGGIRFNTPDADIPLYRVADAFRLEDGRVVVADRGNDRLVVFASDGSLLTATGQAGDGPGEFRLMLTTRPWIGDSIVVWDDRARRVSVMAPDGRFARSFSLSLPEGEPFARVLGVHPDGSFLGQSFVNFGQSAEPGLQRYPVRLHHFQADGSHTKTVGEVPGVEVFYAFHADGRLAGLFPPHFYRSGNHLAGDRLLLAPDDRWELTFSSPDGDARQIVRWLRPPVPVTADQTDEALDRLLERLPDERRQLARDLAGDLDLHATLPAFDRLFYDRAGRVWLETYDPHEPETAEWTIVGPEGRLLATTTLPATARLQDAGSGWALLIVLGEFDDEQLLLATIAQSPPTPP